MGKRLEDGSWKDSCLDKVKPGEPIFVLRAKDKLAPELVRRWASRANAGGTPLDKVNEALECAFEMERWAFVNGSKHPD